ncbi:MAG: hypothetical protein GTO14_05075 [Anaerolineales bacterium]|nr:hypothetical protein [Anaerolineales bacterium]
MSDQVMVCANHPGRETGLRCNRCGKPICVSCAVQTPVGYRCKECVRGQQRVFETASQIDLPVAFVISAVSVGLATFVLANMWIWGLIISPILGGAIAEIVRWAVKRRRSRQLPIAAASGGVVGFLIYLAYGLYPYLTLFLSPASSLDFSMLGSALTSFIWPVAYGLLMISALYYRLRGIRL